MGVIKSLNRTSDKAVDLGEIYYQKTQEYFKLKVFQQLTLTLSSLIKVALLGSLIFLAFIFFVVSGTLALAEVLDSIIYACLIIGFGIVVLALVSFRLRHKVETYIIKKSSKNFFD